MPIQYLSKVMNFVEAHQEEPAFKRYWDRRRNMRARPRVELDGVNYPDWVDVRGYVSDLYRFFYASDLVITQGGGTTVWN